jgi:hypothetical protein
MDNIRTLLEEIKKLDDMRRGSNGKPPQNPMTLYPPAASDARRSLINGGWTHPLPPSYGTLLAASDGVTQFRGQLDFLGTDQSRQNSLRSVVERKIADDKINLRAMFERVDDVVIKEWESEPKRFYVANHPVIAVTRMGGLLFYDSRTINSKGEMELCWRSAAKAVIEKRYENIEKYLEAALQEARKATGVK